jgi:hypothetical protein
MARSTTGACPHGSYSAERCGVCIQDERDKLRAENGQLRDLVMFLLEYVWQLQVRSDAQTGVLEAEAERLKWGLLHLAYGAAEPGDRAYADSLLRDQPRQGDTSDEPTELVVELANRHEDDRQQQHDQGD